MIFWEFLALEIISEFLKLVVNSLRIYSWGFTIWEFFVNSLGIFWEFFRNSLGILWEFFGNSLGNSLGIP